MARHKFITQEQVLSLDVVRDTNVSGHDSERFRVRVLIASEARGEFRISVTETARLGDAAAGAFEAGRIDETLMSLARPYLTSGQYDGEIMVHTGNVGHLLTIPNASEGRTDFDVAVVLYRLLKDEYTTSFDPQLIVRSTGYARGSVMRTLRYFIESGILKYGDLLQKSFSPIQGAVLKLESFIDRGIVVQFPPVGYFREVPLPIEFRKSFLFVLMPFGEKEFPQEWYRSHIKPVLEKEVSMPCYRADEQQGYLQISDQIYSQILSAKAIVAEVSSENANVMLEVGVALAHRKPVFVLFNSQVLPKPAFYLEQIAYHPYPGEAGLDRELSRVAARILAVNR